MTSRSEEKWLEEFNSSFPPEFNSWFDPNWPAIRWSNLRGQWKYMKTVAYEAYLRGASRID